MATFTMQMLKQIKRETGVDFMAHHDIAGWLDAQEDSSVGRVLLSALSAGLPLDRDIDTAILQIGEAFDDLLVELGVPRSTVTPPAAGTEVTDNPLEESDVG